jgi:putative hydrolase of the HAD superfamily
MPAPRPALTAIGFDADDTLWHNETIFQMTQERFTGLLADHAEADTLSARLLDTERRNLQVYGFGIKGFVLSMIETAIEITDGRVPAPVIDEILKAGRDMLDHPVETLPHARETVANLAGRYRIILITKGDLFDQERKLAQSGLGELFGAVEIVSDKTVATYERVFGRHGDGPSSSMMVGNSLKSDVVPAITAGSWGVHVPHDLTWALEHADEPLDNPRYRRINHLGELIDLVDDIG